MTWFAYSSTLCMELLCTEIKHYPFFVISQDRKTHLSSEFFISFLIFTYAGDRFSI